MDERFQFRIDVPRLTLFIDGEGPVDTSNPPAVWQQLVDHFGHQGATRCAYYMTQSCLASHYILECKYMGENEYLLSTNIHQVFVNTVEKTVMVKKRFRMTKMIGNCMYDVDTVTLTLLFNIVDNVELEPRWEYLVNPYYREYNTQIDHEFVVI